MPVSAASWGQVVGPHVPYGHHHLLVIVVATGLLGGQCREGLHPYCFHCVGTGGVWGVLLLQRRMDGAQPELCPLLPGASQLFLSMRLATPLDMENTTVQELLLAKVSCAFSPLK